MKKLVTSNPMPNALICIGGNAMKQYNKKYDINNEEYCVYLKDKTEFSIELFNPLQEKIVCRLIINNKQDGQRGLGIKPGNRVLLDRFLEKNEKFLYETYIVDKNDEIAQEAIKYNGIVRVDFYKEKCNFNYSDLCKYPSTYPSNYNELYPNRWNDAICSSLYYVNEIIGKGKESKQQIEYKNMSHENFPFFSITIKIMPYEQLLLDKKDNESVRKYCQYCGKKI